MTACTTIARAKRQLFSKTITVHFGPIGYVYNYENSSVCLTNRIRQSKKTVDADFFVDIFADNTYRDYMKIYTCFYTIFGRM